MMRAVTAVIALACCLAAACAPAGTQKPSVCFAFQNLETEFWVAGYDAIKDSLNERGFRVLERNANEDANRQLEQVRDCLVQGAEGVIIIPQDADSASALVGETQSQDVPIVVFNRPPADLSKGMIVVADNVAIARAAVEAMVPAARERAQRLGRKVTPIILVGALGDANAVARRKGFQEAIAAHPDVFGPAIEVPTEWSASTALANFEAAVTANPSVDFVFASSDFLFPTVRAVLEPRGLWKPAGDSAHVILGGLDGDATACRMIQDGYVDATGVQDLSFEAKAATDMLVSAIEANEPRRNQIVSDPGFALTQANLAEKQDQTWGCVLAARTPR